MSPRERPIRPARDQATVVASLGTRTLNEPDDAKRLREELLRLPPKARRPFLAAQARLAAPVYEADPEWREVFDGDLHDVE
jgi:hypothetical protein